MNKLLFTSLFIFFASYVFSQNNFIFNPILYQPAVVGIKSGTHISLINNSLIVDNDDFTMNTQTLNFSTSLADGKFGIGGNWYRSHERRDNGIDGNYTANISEINAFGAYNIFFKKSILSFGTSLGVTRDYFYFDYTNIGIQPLIDETDYLFNLGLGVAFSNKDGFVTISSPNVLDKYRYFVNIEDRLSRPRQIAFTSNRLLSLSGGLMLPFFARYTFMFKLCLLKRS